MAKIYFTGDGGIISRANFDGSNVKLILSGLLGGIRDIALLRAPLTDVPALGFSR